jgi:bifunctional non-homologous end joining protein LigD
MERRKTANRRTTAAGLKGARRAASALRAYRGKRDFKRTTEPGGGGASRSSGGLAYVIQRHRATHLHYDLRLEQDGVLKSWAIPKEPSTDPAVKRLAVAVEDHPLAYASFEGRIPPGEYGAGTVEVWDRGTYVPRETGPAARVVELHGRKLRGTFALIRLRPKPGDKHENWLFFKTKTDDGTENPPRRKT